MSQVSNNLGDGELYIAMLKNRHKIILFILLLVGIDQSVKLIVAKYFIDYHFNIIGDFLFFLPKHNTEYSWINSWLNLGIGFLPHILINLIIIIFLYCAFKYYSSKNKACYSLYWAFILILAGALCSLTDKIFWGGSLDYIGIKGFFIFDIKDIYITSSELLFFAFYIPYVMKNPHLLKFNFKRDILLMRDFFRFIFKDIAKVGRDSNEKNH